MIFHTPQVTTDIFYRYPLSFPQSYPQFFYIKIRCLKYKLYNFRMLIKRPQMAQIKQIMTYAWIYFDCTDSLWLNKSEESNKNLRNALTHAAQKI